MTGQGRFARREVRISVLVGAVAALLVVVAGAGMAVLSKPKWTAESVLVVLPSAALDTSDSAAYYETLSRGQIVATFAEVADNLRFQDQAEQNLQLSDAQRAGVTTTVSVVPDTSVILVRTTAGSAAVAEQVADATTTLATAYLAGLSEPYRTDLVHGAEGTATASGTSPIVLLALSVVVALIVGVGVQQAVYHLMVTMRSAKKRKAAQSDPADPADPTDPADVINQADPVDPADVINQADPGDPGDPGDADFTAGGGGSPPASGPGRRAPAHAGTGAATATETAGGSGTPGDARDDSPDGARPDSRVQESMVGPHGR